MENIIQSKMTEQLTGATRREMRQLVDECLSEFSDGEAGVTLDVTPTSLRYRNGF
jgi:hypothetical protein